MSYTRFRRGASDVYVFEHVLGVLVCEMCLLQKTCPDPYGGECPVSARAWCARRRSSMLAHLRRHRRAGHLVPDEVFGLLAEEQRTIGDEVVADEDELRSELFGDPDPDPNPK
jgi:hypothetical protein